MFLITSLNLGNIQKEFMNKMASSTLLPGNIVKKTTMYEIQRLRYNSPIFSGNLSKSFTSKLVLFNYLARSWITSPLKYFYYANYGRGAVTPKRANMLRWTKMPPSMERGEKTNRSDKVFARKSGPVHPTRFVERSTAETQSMARQIALEEVQRWLNG